MDISTFIQHFADQFFDTSADQLHPDTVFRELDEYSSIVALLIMTMNDEEYGVSVSGNEMLAAVTIQDLYNIVQAKLA